MKLRLFRGITVPAATAGEVMARIRERGLRAGDGGWTLPFPKPRDEEDEEGANPGRPGGREYREDELSVCACADVASAAYYAFKHNRFGDRDTPIMIEFEAETDHVAVDGRDMLYTLFQRGDPHYAPDAVRTIYGEAAVRHLEIAWDTDDQLARVARCDRAVIDPEVVAHHYRNRAVVAGRHGTLFSSAFQIRLPVGPDLIRKVHAPASCPPSPPPAIWFEHLLRKGA